MTRHPARGRPGGACGSTPRRRYYAHRPQRRRIRSGLLLGGSGAVASIMVRIVCLQRPQTEPAPQAFATCLVERAPASMACWTVVVVTPTQRQMYISGHGQLDGLDQAADEQRRGWAPPPLPP